ncbi:hypothetical protein GCM10010330_77000 [Streptomyces tendae]|uniref:YbaB/EbfC family nucleoid-associated protein n=1 Tax=Streptomyces tendae TaxID=1932 RepID=UPI00167B8034|nr:YbaB/EbfC family nucleoid-associated protein [Streptomyces tendae]GHB11557.1 hypothetical protein GCM10010330_77000 [Streptomyces tendae]
MDAPPGGRLQEVLAEFAERHRVLSRAREQLNGLSVTAQSRDGVVEATVGADGRASAIRFTGNRFRQMSAPALAGSVLEALTTARTEAAARATAVVMSMDPRLLEQVRSPGPCGGRSCLGPDVSSRAEDTRRRRM